MYLGLATSHVIDVGADGVLEVLDLLGVKPDRLGSQQRGHVVKVALGGLGAALGIGDSRDGRVDAL